MLMNSDECADLILSYFERQSARLCVCEHHLEPFMELGSLEERLKVPQGF